MTEKTIPKDPDAVLDYAFDWETESWLETDKRSAAMLSQCRLASQKTATARQTASLPYGYQGARLVRTMLSPARLQRARAELISDHS